MSAQHLSLAFAPIDDIGHCEARWRAQRTALVLAGTLPPLPSGERAGVRGSGARDAADHVAPDGAIPSNDRGAATPPHPDPLPEGRGNRARARGDEHGFALLRHAGAAARAQAGGCACCRVPSDLVTVLRRLAIERARGEIDVDAVLVAGDAADLVRLEEDALADPFVAARYAVRPAR